MPGEDPDARCTHCGVLLDHLGKKLYDRGRFSVDDAPATTSHSLMVSLSRADTSLRGARTPVAAIEGTEWAPVVSSAVGIDGGTRVC
ncbi:hypothetical protein DHEL01_v211647 [Diaporthe helianthi]|uniref:Uncharacterized protein n=1 Tax=Diaporthe helianthi TaxID=158607 RepID=A0A2P5HI79_DIAHE|nr:hypothetical protein DHEL01_v211647 [Diaporthe helianthi]